MCKSKFVSTLSLRTWIWTFQFWSDQNGFHRRLVIMKFGSPVALLTVCYVANYCSRSDWAVQWWRGFEKFNKFTILKNLIWTPFCLFASLSNLIWRYFSSISFDKDSLLKSFVQQSLLNEFNWVPLFNNAWLRNPLPEVWNPNFEIESLDAIRGIMIKKFGSRWYGPHSIRLKSF